MRPVLVGILLLLLTSHAFAQDFSIIDGRAIRFYKEGEQLILERRYDAALEKFKDAINREASFLEAYVKMSQLLITMGNLEEAERVAESGRSRLSGKNATPKHSADIGWVFSNIYLQKGEFEKAYKQFEAIDPLLDDSFRSHVYYKEMKTQMEFLKTQLGKSMSIEKEKLEAPLNQFQLQYFPVLTADGKQILFTKRDGTGNYDKEDIFTSFLSESDEWSVPRSIASTINSQYNEGTCSVTADGNILIYTSCDAPD
ncbi:MAG TPA: hypothetical protein DEQ87_02305, partial [Algoriphagus sp.]